MMTYFPQKELERYARHGIARVPIVAPHQIIPDHPVALRECKPMHIPLEELIEIAPVGWAWVRQHHNGGRNFGGKKKSHRCVVLASEEAANRAAQTYEREGDLGYVKLFNNSCIKVTAPIIELYAAKKHTRLRNFGWHMEYLLRNIA